MINLNLEIVEVEALLKHIESSAKALMSKIHTQANAQVMAQQQPPVEVKPAE